MTNTLRVSNQPGTAHHAPSRRAPSATAQQTPTPRAPTWLGALRALLNRAAQPITAAAVAITIAAATPQHARADGPAEYPYSVVATTGMVADIVKQVVGDKANVQALMGQGVDPHLYKPTRGDVAAILQADVVFYSGLMLEGRMTDTFVKAARRGKPVYPVTELVDESFLLEPKGFAGHWDPHVWMDVQAWSRCVQAVAVAVAQFDPSHAEHYQANAAAYRRQLETLDAYAKRAIASIPQEQRVLVTAHDAFNYFARAYNIQVLGIQGISTESEAGLADIRKLVDFIVQTKVKAVFVESSVSDKNVKALIEGAKHSEHNVTIGGELFSDAMGPADSYEGTYIGMIDHNVTTITRALGGEAPPQGMQGKLKANHP